MTKTLGGALFVCALAAGNAAAALDWVKFSDVVGKGDTNGGAFLATTGTRAPFETFCIEYSEHIAYGTKFYYSISDAAVAGGGGASGGKDLISETTQAIYYAYLKGQVGGIISSADGDTIANAVQYAIWYEEQELNYLGTTEASVLWNYFDYTTHPERYVAGAQNVRVMNVWTNSDGTGNQQDQLILIPLPTSSGLACAGLLGLVSIRRRRA